jgi:alkylated DNA repair dioxygenase AlkB
VTSAIPGLRYIVDYIDAQTHDELVDMVSAQTWMDVPGQRRMQFYGYTYDYSSRSIKRSGKLPAWAARVAEKIRRDGLSPQAPVQLSVIEYAPGQGIFTHVDAEVFSDVIVISLLSPCVMDFFDSRSAATASLLLEPRSALVLSGDARYRWQHGISTRASDEWNGEIIQRARRISLTFRNVQ